MRSFFPQGLLASVALMVAFAAPVLAETGTLAVTGTGNVSVAPDMATIVIGVQIEDEDAAMALDVASAATAAILATLDDQGIAAADVSSGSIRLSPRYASSALGNGTRIVGYQAVNTVQVRVLDLGQLGGVLAAVVGDGANRLDGVQFGLLDPQSAQDLARQRAVAEGIRLASLYAQAAGVSKGDLLSLSEQGSSGYRPVMAEARQMDMAMSSPQYDVPIAPGNITLSATVHMIFEIAAP